MTSRSPGFFEDVMRNEVHAFDQNVPVKTVLFKVVMPFEHRKVLNRVGFTRANVVWPFTL